MKKVILSIAFLYSGWVSASTQAFEQLWVHSTVNEIKYPWGDQKTQTSKRVIPISGQIATVATVTTQEQNYTGFAVEKHANLLQQIPDYLARVYKTTKWKKKVTPDYTAYEAVSRINAQIVKVYVKTSPHQIKYSLVTMDAGMAADTYGEAEFLEKRMWSGTPPEKTSRWEFFFEPTAWAQDLNSELAALMGMPTNFTLSLDSTDQQMIGQFNSSLANTNATIASQGTAFTSQAAALNGNLSTINGTVNTQMSGLNGNLSNLNTTANAQLGAANANWAKTNAVAGQIANELPSATSAMNNVGNGVQRVSDPGQMAKVGAAFGAGMALGGLAATTLEHVVYDVGTAGGKVAMNEILGRIDPEVRAKMTKEATDAMDALGPLSDRLNALNKQANGLFVAMGQMSKKSVTEVALDNEQRIKDLTGTIDKAKDAYNAMPKSNEYEANRKACSLIISADENILELTRSSQGIVQKIAGEGGSPCEVYQGMHRELAQVQLQLNNARNILVNSIPLLTKKIYDEAKSAEQGEKGWLGNSRPSERKMKNLCPDDELNLSKKVVAKMYCDCNMQGVDRCAMSCEEMKNAQTIRDSCVQSAQTAAENLDPEKQRAIRMGLVAQNVKALQEMQENLVQGICQDKDPKCHNSNASFSAFVTKVNTKMDGFAKACDPSKVLTPEQQITAAATGINAALSNNTIPEQTKTTSSKDAAFAGYLKSSLDQQ